MTTREKILLVLMGLSLLGGATTFLDIPGRSNKIRPKGHELLQKTTEAVHEAASSISNLSLNMEQKYVFAAARRPVSGNPFAARPPESPTSGSKPRQSRPSTPISPAYTGYIAVGTQVLAIIGGLEYREGDCLPGTGDQIRRIRPDKVILYAPTHDREWELPYTGDDL